MSNLPTDAKERKGMPITRGVIDYFPDALAEIARVSLAGNKQHYGPDAPLHWDKSLANDHADCIGRHLIDRGTRDKDGQRHSAKLAWRALALLQIELDEEAAAVSCASVKNHQRNLHRAPNQRAATVSTKVVDDDVEDA